MKHQTTNRAYFLVRSARPIAALAGAVRRVIWGADPEVTIQALKPLEAQVDDSVAVARFGAELLACFGAAALLLAALGIYGVTACSVSLRQHEFGIRMALGSRRAALVRLVVLGAAQPVVAGVVAGLVVSSAVSRAIASLLYGVQAGDPAVLTGSVAVLGLTALAAALVPATRAARVDPVEVLRAE